MAVEWVYENEIGAGLELSVSGTTITAKYYGGTTYSGGIGDNQRANYSGAISGYKDFFNNASAGNPVLIETKTRTGTRGSTYTFSMELTGVYNGASPKVTDSIKVPAAVPGVVGGRSTSSIGKSSAVASWSAPEDNGGTIQGYRLICREGTDNWSGAIVYDTSQNNRSRTITGLDPNKAYSWWVRAYNEAGDGPWQATTSGASFTTDVGSPAAPTIGTPARVSDTSTTVHWSRNSTSAAPYSSQKVLRRRFNDGSWGSYVVRATVSASATSYSDVTEAGSVYNYQVQAINASGTATSGSSANVWTTPLVPGTPSAVKTATGDIVISWDTTPNQDSGTLGTSVAYEVQHRLNSGAWTTLASSVTSGTYTHASPDSSGTHQYRVRTKIIGNGVGTGLTSAYVSSNTVQILAPPNAPINLKTTPAGTIDRSLPVILSWTHNPVDSSAQTKFEIRHREVGSPTWTTPAVVTSGTSAWTLPADTYPTATQVEWEVRTWGLHATASPWSASSTIPFSTRPDVIIQTPGEGEVVGTTQGTVTWSFSDVEDSPQTAWEARLTDLGTGGVLEVLSASGDATSATFTPRLADGGSYEFAVRGREQTGLLSDWATVAVTVNYAPPPQATITALVWAQEQATVDIQFTVPAPTVDEAEVERIEVWRQINEGAWEPLSLALAPDAQHYLDHTPSVSGTNRYLVVTVSATPSTAQSATGEVTTPQEGDVPALWLSSPADPGALARLVHNVEIAKSPSLEKVLRHYAGRTLPLEHSGIAQDISWQISGKLHTRWAKNPDPDDQPDRWGEIGLLAGPHLLRIPSPDIYEWVSISGVSVTRAQGGNVWDISFTATKVSN